MSTHDIRKLLGPQETRDRATYLWNELTRDYRPMRRQEQQMCLRIVALAILGKFHDEDIHYFKSEMRAYEPDDCWSFLRAKVRATAAELGWDYEQEAETIHLFGKTGVPGPNDTRPTLRERRARQAREELRQIERQRLEFLNEMEVFNADVEDNL